MFQNHYEWIGVDHPGIGPLDVLILLLLWGLFLRLAGWKVTLALAAFCAINYYFWN